MTETTPLQPIEVPGRTRLLWRIIAAGALLLALAGVGLATALWQRLNLTQQELARRSQEAGIQAGQAQNLSEQTQTLTLALQARLSLAEARLSEVSLQRSQLEELMASVSRSRDDSLVHDLDSTVRQAQQLAEVTGNAAPLVAALQSASERIARASQPRLNPVQRAISADLERIQRAPLSDVSAAVLSLDELTRQVDDWPLSQSQAFGLASASGAWYDGLSRTVLPEASWWQSVGDWWSYQWRAVWREITQQGRELVRISRLDSPEAALLAPDQAFYLRENIKLRLLNARLALMARHTETARADLQAVQDLLRRYFRVEAPSVASALVVLARWSEQTQSVEMPRPDDTLAALATAAKGR